MEVELQKIFGSIGNFVVSGLEVYKKVLQLTIDSRQLTIHLDKYGRHMIF